MKFKAVFIGFTFLMFGDWYGFFLVLSQDSECPFHLCTPERLDCAGRLMVDERGCELCRCAESMNRTSACSLHGCTVDLLGCRTGLRRDSNGCILCQCDESDSSTHVDLHPQPPNTDEGNSSSADVYLTNQAVNGSSVYCTPTSCPGQACQSFREDIVTGCKTCECDDAAPELDFQATSDDDVTTEPESFCPDVREITQGDGMTRGINTITNGTVVPKYKLVLGKLKKGFSPGQRYKVILKALSNNHLYKEFLLELVSVPFTSRPRFRNPKRTLTQVVVVRTNDRKSKQTDRCEPGYWEEDSEPAESRVFPQCQTAAVESNKTSSKTSIVLNWIAPRCGCVDIRASLVDYTGRQAFLFDGLVTENTPLPASGKINRPLHRTVCVKAVSIAKKRSSKQSRINHRQKNRKGGVNRKNWITADCCNAALSRKSRFISKCVRDASLYYLKKFFRYSVMKRTCKQAYKTCCVRSTLMEEVHGSSRNRTSSRRPSQFDLSRGRENNRGRERHVILPSSIAQTVEVKRNRKRPHKSRSKQPQRKRKNKRPRKERKRIRRFRY